MTAKKDLLGDDIEQARIDSLVTRLFAQEEKELFKFLEKNQSTRQHKKALKKVI